MPVMQDNAGLYCRKMQELNYCRKESKIIDNQIKMQENAGVF